MATERERGRKAKKAHLARPTPSTPSLPIVMLLICGVHEQATLLLTTQTHSQL